MYEDVDGTVERSAFSARHGQEAEAHAHVEPLAHAAATERGRVFFGVLRFFVSGLLTAPLKEYREERNGNSLDGERKSARRAVTPRVTRSPCARTGNA